jgi:hypothetical protein
LKTYRVVLANAFDPTQTTVELLGDLTTLPAAGYLYFEESQDFLAYTAIAGQFLTDVSDAIFCHTSREVLVTYKGLLPSKILAGLELTEIVDPDSLTAAMIHLMDKSFEEYMRVRRYLRAYNNPVFCDLSLVPSLVTSLGLPYVDFIESDEMSRMAVLFAAMLLSEKGTAAAFTTLVYLTTGIHCEVRLIDQFVPLEMDSSYGILLDPLSYFPCDTNTLGLWCMDDASGTTIDNLADISAITDATISNNAMWETASGCSFFDKHINLEFSGTATLLSIPGATKCKTYLGSKNAFSLQMIVKGKTGGAYPQKVINKSGVFSLIRTDATTLVYTVTNGVDTCSYTIIDGISESVSTHLALVFTPDGLSIVKNNEIIIYNYLDGFMLTDIGIDIQCSDSVSGFYGFIDMLRLGSGSEFVAEFLRWYEPAWYLRSSLTSEDLTTYFFGDNSIYNTVEVVLSDDIGDDDITRFIRNIMQDWLGSGSIYYNPSGSLLFMDDFGIF